MDLSKYMPVGIDTETIPTQDPLFIEKMKAKAAKSVKGSGLKKDELIKELKEHYPTAGLLVADLEKLWMEKFGGDLVMKAFEDEHRKTSFSAFDGGEFVSCSAYVFGSEKATGVWRWMEPGTPENDYVPVYGGMTEIELISRFFKYLETCEQHAASLGKKMMLVGANHQFFDMRNLAHRALHLGIDLPKFPLVQPRYSRDFYFDVIDVMSFSDNQSRKSLDAICKFLNIETPKGDDEGDINGAMVWDIWRSGGKHGAERIFNYNKRDCMVLESIFNKIHHLV